MNPILLKTLMSLASSNASGAPRAAGGMDANLRSRTVLYPDEPVDLPRWGISALPSMILGAAPQTCLFVNDLSVGPASTDHGAGSDSTSDHDDADQAGETVSFSLALDSPPDKTSGLTGRKITWQLSMPVAGYRDIKTSANSASVRAPVIRTRMQLRGINRDVEIGLLEMAGLEQPLLIGQDTLGDQFLIRPDRAKDEKPATPPSANLAANTTEAASDDKDKSAPKDAAPQNGDTTPSTPATPTDVAPVTPPASNAQPPSDTSTDTKNTESAVTTSTPDAATPTAASPTPPAAPASPAPTPQPTPSADAANAPQGAPASDPTQATTEHATETPPSPAPQTDTTSTEANTSNTPSTQPTAPVTPPAPSETQPEPKPENT
ncbi:hypothetical protein [Thalassospira lucentensis]|uniref:hypothetical protein n=1 Tax=Thalassospira lucentensis TaxID=168935 RepID=UPI0004241119|nr:hypothetical protein [Thalassospira lucentensis]RCK24664.1 hypothetical protein TH1_14115 [Thalassospira lucentensis MCCC 1A00383 = DSM 14000]